MKCRVCGKDQPLHDFRVGHKRCKACVAEYRKAYRLANEQRERENDRRWYWENREAKLDYKETYRAENREAILARTREWYAANVEHEAQRNKRRRQLDPERYREYARQWGRKHPERNAAKVRLRAAKLRDAKLIEEDFVYMKVLRADPCAYCGSTAGTVDHIRPLSRGGGCGWENLTAACRECNSSKHTASLLAFLARA